MVNNPLANAGDPRDVGSILGQEDPVAVGMAIHSSILAWRIPWTEEPGSYSPWGHRELDTNEATQQQQQAFTKVSLREILWAIPKSLL